VDLSTLCSVLLAPNSGYGLQKCSKIPIICINFEARVSFKVKIHSACQDSWDLKVRTRNSTPVHENVKTNPGFQSARLKHNATSKIEKMTLLSNQRRLKTILLGCVSCQDNYRKRNSMAYYVVRSKATTSYRNFGRKPFCKEPCSHFPRETHQLIDREGERNFG
jgi:hypothetical protein